MFIACNCGHSFPVDDRQSGRFVDCPECRSSCLVRTDASEPRGSDVPQMSLDGPSGDQIPINPELPPLTFQNSYMRIAIDAENGMIEFDNCFVPDTGFWTLRRPVVESYTCSLSDVVRAFRYSTNIGGGDRPRQIVRTTEFVTTAGKSSVSMNESGNRIHALNHARNWKSTQHRDDEGERDERLQEICDYLDSKGYVSVEGTPPSHFILWGVILLVAVVMVILAFNP
jgi:DNA-directed RNA polymerase subunit RPC12/RpoP